MLVFIVSVCLVTKFTLCGSWSDCRLRIRFPSVCGRKTWFVHCAHSGHWKWDAGVNAHLNTPEYDQFIANDLGYSRVCIRMIIWIIGLCLNILRNISRKHSWICLFIENNLEYSTPECSAKSFLKTPVLASAPLHTQDTEIGLGALVWQPQPSFSISDRSCLMAEKSRQNASRIARQKMKTGCERQGERESERRREDRATKLGRTRKTIRCYQSEQQDMVRAEQTG